MTTQNPLFTIQKYLMSKLAAPINYGHALDLDIANLKAQVAELNITFEHFTGLNVQDAKSLVLVYGMKNSLVFILFLHGCTFAFQTVYKSTVLIKKVTLLVKTTNQIQIVVSDA